VNEGKFQRYAVVLLSLAGRHSASAFAQRRPDGIFPLLRAHSMSRRDIGEVGDAHTESPRETRRRADERSESLYAEWVTY